MFENLKGIKPERDIQPRAESALEKLLKIEEGVRKEYAGKVSNGWDRDHNDIYLPMYKSLSSTLPEYTEHDLQSLLLAKANNNYNNHEAKVLGMYTGVLLHLLAERYEHEGKKTALTFDLLGNEFHYLFYFAKRAGEVTVKKVKGEYTCFFFASYGGKAEKLVIEGNEGNYAASFAGSYQGNVGTLIIKDNKGNGAASFAGSYDGKVGTLIIRDNKGDWAAYDAGGLHGNVGTLIIKDNTGDWAASDAGRKHGNIGTLIIKDNEGGLAAHRAGSYQGNVGTLALYNAGRDAGDEANATTILTGKEALTLYQKLEKELPCLKA